MQELGGVVVVPMQAPSVLAAAPTPCPLNRIVAAADGWKPEVRSWRAELGRVIEGDILPRLFLAHDLDLPRAARSPRPPRGRRKKSVAERFAETLLADDADESWDYLAPILAAGTSEETTLLEILAPAARHLGSLWEADDCDFVEVTVGVHRLQRILHRLSPENTQSQARREEAPRALLLPTPGESHVFGISMVETFFRNAGWRVNRGEIGFLDDLRKDWFDVVGFSLSSPRHVESLCAAVRQSRAASKNRSIMVLVGGPIFAEDETLVARVGADATAVDASAAIHMARNLLGKHPRL